MMVGGTQWTMDSSQFIVNVQSWVEGSIVHVSMISSYQLGVTGTIYITLGRE